MDNRYNRHNRRKYSLKAPIVLVTKYRRQLLKGTIADDVKQKIFDICNSNSWNIIAMETDKDHIHMLISYPPNISVSSIVRRLKQCSTLSLWKQFPIMLSKQFCKECTFWSDGYFVCSIGEANPNTIKQYILTQG